jgi:hypothetical protein
LSLSWSTWCSVTEDWGNPYGSTDAFRSPFCSMRGWDRPSEVLSEKNKSGTFTENSLHAMLPTLSTWWVTTTPQSQQNGAYPENEEAKDSWQCVTHLVTVSQKPVWRPCLSDSQTQALK